MSGALNLFRPGEPGFRCLAPSWDLIVGHARQWPRRTVPVAVIYQTLPGTLQGCFRHCGSYASYIATFDPQSRQSDITEDILSYFAVVEWALPLSFLRFGPQSRWGRRAGV